MSWRLLILDEYFTWWQIYEDIEGLATSRAACGNTSDNSGSTTDRRKALWKEEYTIYDFYWYRWELLLLLTVKLF